MIAPMKPNSSREQGLRHRFLDSAYHVMSDSGARNGVHDISSVAALLMEEKREGWYSEFMQKPILLGAALALALLGAGCEREGTVDTYGCREMVKVTDEDWERIFLTFTCDTQRTAHGKIMEGRCVHIKLEGSECVKAYYYEQQSEITCSEEYPYLGRDEKCYSGPVDFGVYAPSQ